MSTRTKAPHRPAGGPAFHSNVLGRSYRRARVVGIVVIFALVLTIGWVASRGQSESQTRPSTTAAGAAVPAHLSSTGSIAVGDGPVAVAVYFDYLCPACGAFEAANGEELDALLESGVITLELRPIAFLDRLSAGTEYSTRTANALATVVDRSPQHVWPFHRALYAHQPREGGPGLDDEEIEAVAVGAGVPVDVAEAFTKRRSDTWVAERTERAFADGVQGTPTIVVDGTLFAGDPYTPGDLRTAIERAAR